jgi:hypothetical protein
MTSIDSKKTIISLSPQTKAVINNKSIVQSHTCLAEAEAAAHTIGAGLVKWTIGLLDALAIVQQCSAPLPRVAIVSGGMHKNRIRIS